MRFWNRSKMSQEAQHYLFAIVSGVKRLEMFSNKQQILLEYYLPSQHEFRHMVSLKMPFKIPFNDVRLSVYCELTPFPLSLSTSMIGHTQRSQIVGMGRAFFVSRATNESPNRRILLFSKILVQREPDTRYLTSALFDYFKC